MELIFFHVFRTVEQSVDNTCVRIIFTLEVLMLEQMGSFY
jgi:hypothetical protein